MSISFNVIGSMFTQDLYKITVIHQAGSMRIIYTDAGNLVDHEILHTDNDYIKFIELIDRLIAVAHIPDCVGDKSIYLYEKIFETSLDQEVKIKAVSRGAFLAGVQELRPTLVGIVHASPTVIARATPAIDMAFPVL